MESPKVVGILVLVLWIALAVGVLSGFAGYPQTRAECDAPVVCEMTHPTTGPS